MPGKQWSAKRERQYQHIRGSLLPLGKLEEVADEMAALGLTDRPRHRATRETTRSYDQLYNEARSLGVKGRSAMSKAALLKAVED
ncbi:MAG: hypothetical protein H7Y33_14480 [Cytophagales bacterium]|nr:hypothetical protein [Rhizobacter sp.]